MDAELEEKLRATQLNEYSKKKSKSSFLRSETVDDILDLGSDFEDDIDGDNDSLEDLGSDFSEKFDDHRGGAKTDNKSEFDMGKRSQNDHLNDDKNCKSGKNDKNGKNNQKSRIDFNDDLEFEDSSTDEDIPVLAQFSSQNSRKSQNSKTSAKKTNSTNSKKSLQNPGNPLKSEIIDLDDTTFTLEDDWTHEPKKTIQTKNKNPSLVEFLGTENGTESEILSCLIVNCRERDMVITDGTSTCIVKNLVLKTFQTNFKKYNLIWKPENLFNSMYSFVLRKREKCLPHVELIDITHIQIGGGST